MEQDALAFPHGHWIYLNSFPFDLILMQRFEVWEKIICCCVAFALRAKATQQQVFSYFSKNFSNF